MTYELEARNDSRQSFYGKARVETDYTETEEGVTDRIKLISYTTHVASIVNGQPEVYGTYSPTTLRHIKEFLIQNGFKAESKAQIEKDYMK